MYVRSARTIARWAVHSTRAGTWCMLRLGGSLNCLRARREPLRGERFTALAPALGVCPGWAVVQLFARSARIIARRGLSTRAGPRCLPRLGGRSIVYTLGANHCAAGGSQRPDGSWYQPFRSSPTHLIFQSVFPLRLRPVDYLSYRQTFAICSHAFLLKNGRYMMRKYKQGPNAPSPGRCWKQAEQNNHRSLSTVAQPDGVIFSSTHKPP